MSRSVKVNAFEPVHLASGDCFQLNINMVDGRVWKYEYKATGPVSIMVKWKSPVRKQSASDILYAPLDNSAIELFIDGDPVDPRKYEVR